ncbi:MAG: hypothetical protein H7331_01190 [Bacteroidia bacterium]|nr:hypothetical protein [Bacteroidia bacterium]
MKQYYILLIALLVVCADLYVFSNIASLLSKQSNVAVVIGAVLFCLFIVGNFILVYYAIKKFNKKK